MAITHVQEIGSTAGNAAASIQVSPGSNTTAGNTIIAASCYYRASGAYPTASFSDSAGNTYTTIYNYTSGSSSNGPNLMVAAAFNASQVTTSGNVKVTFTGGAGAPFSILGVDEFSGLGTSMTQDGSNVTGTAISSSTPAFGTLTTTNANDLVLCYMASFGNLTASSWSTGWNTNKEFQSSAPTLSWSYQIVSSTSSFSGTVTLAASEVSDYVLFALQAAGGGGGATPTGSTLMSLGVG